MNESVLCVGLGTKFDRFPPNLSILTFQAPNFKQRHKRFQLFGLLIKAQFPIQPDELELANCKHEKRKHHLPLILLPNTSSSSILLLLRLLLLLLLSDLLSSLLVFLWLGINIPSSVLCSSTLLQTSLIKSQVDLNN